MMLKKIKTFYLIIIIILFSAPLNVFSQWDTLMCGFDTFDAHYILNDISIDNPKYHKVAMSFSWTKKNENNTKLRYYFKLKNRINILNKKMAEVKILYISNPFGIEDVEDLDPMSKELYIKKSLLYEIPFEKMTSLKEIYFMGDDIDNIISMPNSFYSTNVETIYCLHIKNFDDFSRTIKQKKPSILVTQIKTRHCCSVDYDVSCCWKGITFK